MLKNLSFLLTVLLAASLTPAKAALFSSSSPVIAERLRCEYLADPLGIDVEKPRLSWIIEDRNQLALRSLGEAG